MKLLPFPFLLALFLTCSRLVSAQDTGRVMPALLPLPLPTGAPLPPNELRAHNPWNLPLTGPWRFQLTHGEIKDGQFQRTAALKRAASASSRESGHPAQDAFDGNPDTRWCAQGDSFPQWLQADLGEVQQVSGVQLAWEHPEARYQCRVEGRTQEGTWITLADATATPGVGDGVLKLTTPTKVRYVRVVITGTSKPLWASIREYQILLSKDGQDVPWHPPESAPETPEQRDAFAAPSFDDARWDTQNVPFNWEVLGYSLPTYNDVDDTVGLYRRTVAVPATWAGRRVYWHFDGVFDGAEVFVNGQRAGYHESGYTAFDVDLTGLVKPGENNLLAVRVCKATPSYDADTGDFQSLGGIYRDASLIAVPETRIDDLTIQTPLSANYRDAALNARVHVMGTAGQSVEVTGELFGQDGHPAGVNLTGSARLDASGGVEVALSAPVSAPRLWSAEKPNLYYVIFALSSEGKLLEKVEQRFGFRQVEINQDHIVLWNGVPIKCTGMCRHDFWADQGFALTEDHWQRDVTLLKAANVNAVRTSHYNHAQRFLELCDEQGLYILDEVPYCWIGGQVNDPAYTPFLLQRARETLARDKNRPCVLAWSLGNENPNGADSQAVIDWVRAADPTRPAFVSDQTPDRIKGQPWEDAHYPDPERVDHLSQNPRFGANLSEHPHTFYEEEVQAYDPGASDVWSEALIKTWDKLWRSPTILGSFIWEWQNQGIADKNPDTDTEFWFGPDHLRQENNKGVVDAYRHPKPEWWIVKSVYSPVAVTARTIMPREDGTCTVPVTNRYAFTDLGELTCHWTALKAGEPLKTGTVNVACAPAQSVRANFPSPAGTTSLRLDFQHADGASVIAYQLAVEGVPVPAAPPALAAGETLAWRDGAESLVVTNSTQQLGFDKSTGAIHFWRVGGHNLLLPGGPGLNLGEGRGKNMYGDDKGVYSAMQPSTLGGVRVVAVPAADGAAQVTVTGTVHEAIGGRELGTLTTVYTVLPNAELRVDWKLAWSTGHERLWEEGLKFNVPAALDRMAWQRDAFFTDYPAGHLGEPSGTARTGEALFRASKRGLRWLTLTAADGTGLALLPTDAPLVGRTKPAANGEGTTLCASRKLAADYGLTRQWVDEHNTHVDKGQVLSGSFLLRAIRAPKLVDVGSTP